MQLSYNCMIKNSLTTLVKQGCSELFEGVSNWRICHLIGAGDLRRRYARSLLGQFWLTLSTGITIMIMAFVWSVLFKSPLKEMLPHLAVSIIIWQFIAGVVIDATTLFTSSNHMLLSQRLVCSTVVYASVYRNFLILLHNLVIIPIVFLILGVPFTLQILLIVPALILILISSVWITYIVAALSVRFRDLANLLNSFMQLAFYVTPVIWKPGFMVGHEWVIWINPFAYYLSIIRSPLLGEAIVLFEWGVVGLITLVGLMLSVVFIGKYRRKLLFWL